MHESNRSRNTIYDAWPEERVWNEDLIKAMLDNKRNLLIGAIEDEKIIGFLSAERESYRSNRHSAYVVTGIRKAYCYKGIRTQFFVKFNEWAKENN